MRVQDYEYKKCWLSDKWSQMDNDVLPNFYCA